jgi:hypothetical protein
MSYPRFYVTLINGTVHISQLHYLWDMTDHRCNFGNNILVITSIVQTMVDN